MKRRLRYLLWVIGDWLYWTGFLLAQFAAAAVYLACWLWPVWIVAAAAGLMWLIISF